MTSKMERGFYGFTIKSSDNPERRARPHGNQKRILARGFEIISTDIMVKSLTIWDNTGRVYRTWIKNTSGKIKRIK